MPDTRVLFNDLKAVRELLAESTSARKTHDERARALADATQLICDDLSMFANYEAFWRDLEGRSACIRSNLEGFVALLLESDHMHKPLFERLGRRLDDQVGLRLQRMRRWSGYANAYVQGKERRS